MDIKNVFIKTVVAIFFSMSFQVGANSYQPDDNFVLLKIKEANIIRQYRKKLEKQPNDIGLLTASVSALVLQAKKQNSDILYGKIESILVLYKQNVKKSDKLKVMYADVLQHRHAFKEAIQVINKINTVNANLLRASIYQSLGDYSLASQECKKLIGKISIIIASTCLVHAQSYQGRIDSSYKTLKKISTGITAESKDVQSWVLTALAEISQRMGESLESLSYYQRAHQLSPRNTHILSDWVDVLHSLNEQEKILALLAFEYNDIRLNLRYQRALILTATFNYEKHRDLLKNINTSILITELRKDARHYDTRAEYYTWINKDPVKALYWAKNNWDVFKTPGAAKLLLLTANNAKDQESINMLYRWKKANKIQDIRLRKIIVQKNSFGMDV